MLMRVVEVAFQLDLGWAQERIPGRQGQGDMMNMEARRRCRVNTQN